MGKKSFVSKHFGCASSGVAQTARREGKGMGKAPSLQENFARDRTRMIPILMLTLLNLTPTCASTMTTTNSTTTTTGALSSLAKAEPRASMGADATGELSQGREPFIKKMRFQVPESARIGNTMKLSCVYELSGASLHAMKLFKDDKEFYRFTPAIQSQPNGGGDEQRIAFPSPGLKVDLARSNDQDIWIKVLDKRAAGTFKCQVSIEDTFKSISAEKRMDVIERTRTVPSAGSGPAAATNWLGSQATSSSSTHPQQRHAVQQQQQQQGSQRNRAQASFMQQQPQASSGCCSSNNRHEITFWSCLLTMLIITVLARQQQEVQHHSGVGGAHKTRHSTNTQRCWQSRHNSDELQQR